jgi:hypothetical protein
MLAPSTPRRELSEAKTASMAFTFPLLLACVALILILIFALFFPAALGNPGIESFMVAP